MKTKRPKHPDFRNVSRGSVINKSYILFIFYRVMHIEPTAEQLDSFRQREKAVELLGGRMKVMAHQCAGKRPPFAPADCIAMEQAVIRSNPHLRIDSHWNGISYYGYTIACLPKRAAKKRSRR